MCGVICNISFSWPCQPEDSWIDDNETISIHAVIPSYWRISEIYSPNCAQTLPMEKPHSPT
jgi:hypothetical protein